MTKRRKASNSLSQETPMPTAMEIVCPAIAPVIAPTGVASIIRTRSQIKKPVKGADSSSESNTVQSVGSNQTIETQNQTQIRIRSNALADDLTADQEASQAVSPGKSARSKSQPKEPAQPQSEAPSAGSTPNLLAPPGKQAAVASLISSSKSLPHTGSQEPYSAIDSLASPRSIEEFNLNRLQAIKLNNKRVYSNVARDLGKYIELIDQHLTRFNARIDKLVEVSLVKESIVKNSHVVKILERKESLKKAKIYLTEHVRLFQEASSSVCDVVIECPALPEDDSDSADCNELTRLVFEKQMLKKKIHEIQSGLLALREVYQVDSIEEKNLVDFNFKSHETELAVLHNKLHGLFKAMCKLEVADDF